MSATLLFNVLHPPLQPFWVICRRAEIAFRFPVDSSACPAVSIAVSKLSSRHYHLKICGCQGGPLEQEGDGSRSVPDQGCKPEVQDFHWKRGRNFWVVFHCDNICHMLLYVFDKHNTQIFETIFFYCLTVHILYWFNLHQLMHLYIWI